MTRRAILVVAKAPVPGQVKTRLMAAYSAVDAARLAAAALIDTLDVALAVPDAEVVVSLAGDISAAVAGDEIASRLNRSTVVGQVGDTLGERLHRAHVDAAEIIGGGAVMQVGMDTPQLTVAHLESGLRGVADHDAALGMATDGGWWGLAIVGARGAQTLPGVPMSQHDTGARTLDALRADGRTVALLEQLTDVDHPTDVLQVAEKCAAASAFAVQVSQLRSAVRP